MAKCCGTVGGCGCVVKAGPNVDITGNGTLVSPYEISAIEIATDEMLADYLANPGSATSEQMSIYVDEQVQEVVEGHTPGAEMAYAELTTPMSNTTVFPTVPAVTPLALSVTGTGRPVEIEFYVCELLHSVANGGCAATIVSQKDGGAVAYEQVILHYTPKTTFGNGSGLSVKRRKVLDAGSEYLFNFGLTGLVAGTWYAGGIAGVRTMYTQVTAR